MRALLPVLLALLLSAAPELQAAGAKRSATARAAFVREQPCPAVNRTPRSRACPGFVVDHIVPLCAGGADAPSNMQWQDRRASLRKDVHERRQCAQLRRKSK